MPIFQHTHVPIPEDGIFKISPSQIGNFFASPVLWYREQVLGEDGFTGSTASVLGTSIHHIAEVYANSIIDSTTVDWEAVRSEIETELDDMYDPNVDIDEVKSLYRDMGRELCNEYIKHNPPTSTEQQVCQEVHSGIYIAGSLDAYDERTGTITDYKSAGKKPSDSIPFNYKIQTLAYAWALRQSGKEVNRICIAYVVRPTKTIGIRVIPIYHQITQSDWQLIDDTLNLIADSVLFCKENPDLAYIVFKSMNLKV